MSEWFTLLPDVSAQASRLSVAGDLAGKHRVSGRVADLWAGAPDARPIPVLAVAAGPVEVHGRAALESPAGRAVASRRG